MQQKNFALFIGLLAVSVYLMTLRLNRRETFDDIHLPTLQPEVPIMPLSAQPIAPPSSHYVTLQNIVPVTGEFPKIQVSPLYKKAPTLSIDYNWQFFSTNI